MWQQEFIWFFAFFHHEFRKHNAIAFEVLMVLAVAHVFGFYQNMAEDHVCKGVGECHPYREFEGMQPSR